MCFDKLVNPWTALGFFLLGVGTGALLTFIVQAGRLRRVRAEPDLLPNREQQREEDQTSGTDHARMIF